MRLRRGISPAITALVLLGIAIAVGIVVGIHVMSQTRSMSSRGATLQLTVDAHDAGNKYTAVTIVVKNTGPEDVKITKVAILVGDSEKCSKTPNKEVKAGASASFALVCQTGQGIGGVIAVKVEGQTTRTQIPVQASATAEILP